MTRFWLALAALVVAATLVAWHGYRVLHQSLAVDIDAQPLLIHPGDTGLLTPAQDVGRLANSIERVLRDPALREQLAGHGLNHYRHRYSEQ